MAIAASITISSSRRLRFGLIVMVLIASVCCAQFVRALPIIYAGVFAATYVVVVVVASLKFLHNQTSVRLDIANNGRMILRHSLAQGRWSDGVLVRFDGRSVLWEYYVSLRLIDESSHTHLLAILPDSVAEGEFRRLLVALKWIAMRTISEDTSEDVNQRNF